jgi:CRISPR-associated protein Csb2
MACEARLPNVWQTVAAAVLPAKRPQGKMSGTVRAEFDQRLSLAVVSALRHAGVRSPASVVAVQREPFFARGARADMFEPGRFNASQLFHVDIQFEGAVAGPLTVGDGRWLELGLMRPVRGLQRSPEVPGAASESPELEEDQDAEIGDEM